MTDTKAAEVDTKAHEAEGSWMDGWPAMLLSLAIISAAVYSFSPRPKPAFPATQIQPNELLITDLARQGERLIGVGEQGRILYADSWQGPWQEATLDRKRGATFTEVQFLDDRTAVAVGHDSWIMRSTDGGASWTEVMFDPDKAEPLLGVAGPFDGRLYAYGAFGQLQVSSDGGRSWQRRELVKEEAPAQEGESGGADPFADPFADGGGYDPFSDDGGGGGDPFGGGGGGDYNPFEDFGSGGFDDFSTRHLNAITQASDGSLWLAGERGLIARSVNGGETWTQFDTGYNGSFYGIIETDSGRMLAHGMRGNIYSTRDGGESFQLSKSGTEESLYGGRMADNGDILLVGGSNMIIRSNNGGRTFAPVSDKKRDALADLLILGEGLWLTAGEGGIRVQGPNAPDGKN